MNTNQIDNGQALPTAANPGAPAPAPATPAPAPAPTKKSSGWTTGAAFSFIGSGIMLATGFFKMLVYENSEYSYTTTNAYVGGDAYNYIINGNYATGFFVLAGALLLAGVGFLLLDKLTQLINQNRTQPQGGIASAKVAVTTEELPEI